MQLVSALPDGTQFNALTLPGHFSADGRYYVFSSYASNIVAGDTNGLADVFVQDRQSGQIRLVSRALSGSANGESIFCSISADGSKIAFNSLASNLVQGDTNNIRDVFLYDRVLNRVLGRVSLTDRLAEAQGGDDRFPSAVISGDGNWITFTTEASNMLHGVRLGGYSNVFITNSEVPIPFTPVGPNANPYQLLMSGNANTPLLPFDVSASTPVTGELAPSPQDPTNLTASVTIPDGPLFRNLQIHVQHESSSERLAVGTTIYASEADGTSITYSEAGATFPNTTRYNYKSGTTGTLTIVSLTPGPGNGATVGIRLDGWEMVPDPSTNPGNSATGSFVFNGTLTLTIP